MAGALKILEGVSRKNAELPSGHVLMYQILAQLNQPNVARFELERAIHEAPSDPEPYVILGNIALQDRRVAEATMDFDKAKQLLASYTNAKRKAAMEQQTLSGIAQVAEAGENWKDAEVRLRDLLKIAPDDLLAHQRLARALFWQGKAQESYDMLKAAKAIDRENAKKNKTKEVFLTPGGHHGQVLLRIRGRSRPNPEKWYKAALKTAPRICPPARSWPSGPWKKVKSPLPRSRRSRPEDRSSRYPTLQRQQRGPHAPRPGRPVGKGMAGRGELISKRSSLRIPPTLRPQ